MCLAWPGFPGEFVRQQQCHGATRCLTACQPGWINPFVYDVNNSSRFSINEHINVFILGESHYFCVACTV